MRFCPKMCLQEAREICGGDERDEGVREDLVTSVPGRGSRFDLED